MCGHVFETGCMADTLVQRHVLVSDPLDAEPGDRERAHAAAIEFDRSTDGCRQVFFAFGKKAADSAFDDFRQCSSRQRDHRSAARHRFDGHETKRFLAAEREEAQAARPRSVTFWS